MTGATGTPQERAEHYEQRVSELQARQASLEQDLADACRDRDDALLDGEPLGDLTSRIREYGEELEAVKQAVETAQGRITEARAELAEARKTEQIGQLRAELGGLVGPKVRDEFRGGVGTIVAAVDRMVAAVRTMETHRERVHGLRCQLAGLEGTPQPVRAEPVTPADLGVDRDHLPWLRVAHQVIGKDRQTALHMVAELLAYLPQSGHSAAQAARDLTQEDLRAMPTPDPEQAPPVGPGRTAGLPELAVR